jgi:serine/threonine-protein kinase
LVDYLELELPTAERNDLLRVGRYTLVRRIAAGGMASVHLAYFKAQAGFQKFVAIKRPLAHLIENPAIVQMFLNEARLVSRLEHENICPIVDFGSDEDGPYLVMPYLHGEPLGDLNIFLSTTRTPVPVDLMAYIAAGVLDGLYYAHNAKSDGRALELVHRDITPSNIFITYDGSVKILDFGVAKAIAPGHDGLSVAGAPKGKFAYMSPEQSRGDPLDQRSDLFSLGVVLWESLTGLRLFRRETGPLTLLAIGECQVPRFKDVGAKHVPAELAQIVYRALSARRQDRYPSAREMGRELRRYLAHREAILCPTEVAAMMRMFFPRRAEERDPLAQATEPRARMPEEDLNPTIRLERAELTEPQRAPAPSDSQKRGQRPSGPNVSASPPPLPRPSAPPPLPVRSSAPPPPGPPPPPPPSASGLGTELEDDPQDQTLRRRPTPPRASH